MRVGTVKAVSLVATTLTATALTLSYGPLAPGRFGMATAGAASVPSTASPHHVVVLGDSTALDLGYALGDTEPAGTSVSTQALLGCGLAIASKASVGPGYGNIAMSPPCNEGSPPSHLWPPFDTQAVAGTGPGDVVLFIAGPWETPNFLVSGTWTNITQSAFHSTERHRLGRLIGIATAHGAHLDLLTLPCGNINWQTGGAPPVAESAKRRASYNKLLAAGAAAHPGTVSVIDLNHLLCPYGNFRLYLDGVQIRATDGVHTPTYAAGNSWVTNASPSVAHRFNKWLSPRLWPKIVASATS